MMASMGASTALSIFFCMNAIWVVNPSFTHLTGLNEVSTLYETMPFVSICALSDMEMTDPVKATHSSELNVSLTSCQRWTLLISPSSICASIYMESLLITETNGVFAFACPMIVQIFVVEIFPMLPSIGLTIRASSSRFCASSTFFFACSMLTFSGLSSLESNGDCLFSSVACEMETWEFARSVVFWSFVFAFSSAVSARLTFVSRAQIRFF